MFRFPLPRSHDSIPDIILDEIRGPMIAATWHLLEPLLQSGIDRVSTSQTTAALRVGAEIGTCRLWAIYQREQPMPLLAAAATYVRRTNKGQVAVIDTIGGHDMDQWLEPALAEFAALAKANGVDRIEVEGRLGWLKALPGFKATRIIMHKELT